MPIRTALDAIEAARALAADQPLLPPPEALHAMVEAFAKLKPSELPEPARSHVLGARSMLLEAQGQRSQNAWARLRLHVETAHAELSKLARDATSRRP